MNIKKFAKLLKTGKRQIVRCEQNFEYVILSFKIIIFSCILLNYTKKKMILEEIY